MRLILLVFGLMLLLGCTGGDTVGDNKTPTAPAGPTTPNQTQQNKTVPAQMTCDEYCKDQPHIQCVGTWNISGTYPNCVCSFECDTQPAQNNTNMNQTPPGTMPENVVAVTIFNISSLMSNGLSKIRTDFYSAHDGSFIEKSYTWTYDVITMEPGEITVDSPLSIEFDGSPVSSLRASAFTVFTDKSTDEDTVKGLAIFLSQTTPLDSFKDPFDIEYLNPAMKKELTDCQIYEKVHMQDLEKKDMLLYYFDCTGIEDI